jgi:proline dehydrogenase
MGHVCVARGPCQVRTLRSAHAPYRGIVQRFVAGPSADEVLLVSRALADDGLSVSLDHLSEETRTIEQAVATRDEYVSVLGRLKDAGLAPAVEVSVKLSALGRRIDEKLAYEHARAICAAAAEAGTTVTLDAEDHAGTDATLETLVELATAGSRVRLCKGAYAEPESVAFQSALDVDKSFVRCLNILMSGEGYPMVATHDARLIAIAEDRARWFDRSTTEYEFQMLYGVRPEEQSRLAAGGHTVRVHLPYGEEWYGDLMRRLAERPANVGFLARAVASRK